LSASLFKNLKKEAFVKTILLLTAFFFIKSISFGQTEKVEIKIIDSIPVTKQELYIRARAFIAYSFKNSKNVIQMDDKEAGKIICKGSMTLPSKASVGITYQNNVDFTLTIDVRDNKYRAVISDLYHSGLGSQKEYAGGAIENEKPSCGTFFIPKKDWEKIKEAIKKEAKSYLDSLKEAMLKESKPDDF
jgi:hypothetical protein